MAQTSPILRFALEVLHHALESYSTDTPRHRKIAVLHLAQATELAVKAALVENNIPIYDKGGRTLNIHDALASLAKLWGVERIDGHARLELMVDERNSIQHRYGNVDDVSLDYHMETAFDILRSILEREFDTGLDAWIRDNVLEETWTKIRFVQPAQPTAETPSDAVMQERSATLDFIDGFARYERSIRQSLEPLLDKGERFSGSTLDLMIKALSNAPLPRRSLIQGLPEVYRLRNRVIHGDSVPESAEVRKALELLDEALHALESDVAEDVLALALKASQRGVKGTKLPSRAQEAQEDFQPIAQAEVEPPG